VCSVMWNQEFDFEFDFEFEMSSNSKARSSSSKARSGVFSVFKMAAKEDPGNSGSRDLQNTQE